MENNRGQSIFLSVVGIATLLVAIVGATFAYFSIQVAGNEGASSINVQTAQVGGVNYLSTSDAIEVDNLYPGWSADKTFTIATTELADTQTISYTIDFVVTDGELATQAIANDEKEFYYTLSATRTSILDSNLATDVVTKTEAADMPDATTTNGAVGTGILRGTEVHSYTMHIALAELGAAQNDLQGLSYAGSILVEVADGQGQRTYDSTNANGQHYKTWTAEANTTIP